MYGFTSLILLILAAKSPTDGIPVSRIVGGSDAPDGAYPYQVSLRIFDFHFCGGSIISSRWILTAGHCVDGTTAELLKVITGTNKLNETGKSYQASIVVRHENYDPWWISNDVGLVGVDENIVYNDKVQPISLPLEDFDKSDYPAVLSGWGTTKLGGNAPNCLQQINLTVISQRQCISIHGEMVTNGNICSLTQAGEGACHGDSGGPLVSDGIQIGIVSWGSPCAMGRPDVYTRVWHFIDWIRKHTSVTPQLNETIHYS